MSPAQVIEALRASVQGRGEAPQSGHVAYVRAATPSDHTHMTELLAELLQ